MTLQPKLIKTESYHQWIETPIGQIAVCADQHQLLQVNIIPATLFAKDPTSKLQTKNRAPIQSNHANAITKQAVAQINAYFEGTLIEFNLPIPFDDRHFCGKACLSLYNYNFGQTLSYKELAQRAGNIKASRAAGHAMSSNPVPIVVPCHRVLASDGSLGGFLYGLKMKAWLLKHEQKVMTRFVAQAEHKFNSKQLTQMMSVDSLKPIFEKMPVKDRYSYYKEPFTALVSSLIYQQINFKTAVSIEAKFLAHFNYQITPEILLNLEDSSYRQFGISAGKAKYIRNVSRFFITDGDIFHQLIAKKNYQQISIELLKIKGIGRWTIDMFMLFCLRAPNIFSTNDLIIANGLKHILHTEVLTSEQIEQFRKSIAGIETLVSINLWQYMGGAYF